MNHIECYIVLSPDGQVLDICLNKGLCSELCYQRKRKAQEEKLPDDYTLTTGVLTYETKEKKG